jgi:GTP-binding protein
VWQVPFSLVFTKADKNKPAATQRKAEVFMQKLSERWEAMPEYFITSAVTRSGRHEMLGYIDRLNQKLKG